MAPVRARAKASACTTAPRTMAATAVRMELRSTAGDTSGEEISL